MKTDVQYIKHANFLVSNEIQCNIFVNHITIYDDAVFLNTIIVLLKTIKRRKFNNT